MNFLAATLAATCAGLVVGPAAAECPTAADIADFGVTFTHKDGGETDITLEDGLVIAQYADRYGEPLAFAALVHGVFPRGDQRVESVDPAAGRTTPWPPGAVERQIRYSGQPPVPQPGKSWTGQWTETRRDAAGETSLSFTATYRFGAPQSVTLGDCTIEVMGAEASFAAQAVTWSARWLYFPTLGVGVQTRGTDPRTGEAWSNGISAIG